MRLSSFLIATTVMFGLVRAAQAGLYDGQPIAATTPGAASPADPVASPSDGSFVSQATLSLPSVTGNSCGCAGCSGCCNGCGGDGCQSFQSGPCDCNTGCCGCNSCPPGGYFGKLINSMTRDGRLLGFIAPSDRLFSDFISPMTNPVYFEDPRTLSEARVIFLNNELPGPVVGGGNVQLLASQFRAAITNRLSIIATKDGYIFSPKINGWANVNLGLKYNLYANPATQRLLSAAVIYELPVGSTHALQGNGDGVIDLTLTGGMQIGGLWHLVSAGGFRLPTDPYKQNDQLWWSTHVDRRLQTIPLYGFFECNLYHWTSGGTHGLPGVEGLDLYNLGSSGVAGSTIVTGAIGTKYKFGQLNEIGVAWEVPLTQRRDIMDSRIQADLILRY